MDRSRLKVNDEYGNIAIDLNYINPNRLLLSGTFNHKGLRLAIDDHGIHGGFSDDREDFNFKNDCFYDHRLNLTKDHLILDTDKGIPVIINYKTSNDGG